MPAFAFSKMQIIRLAVILLLVANVGTNAPFAVFNEILMPSAGHSSCWARIVAIFGFCTQKSHFAKLPLSNALARMLNIMPECFVALARRF